MDEQEQKFFEDLAKFGTSSAREPKYEIELAKANATASRPKIVENREEEEDISNEPEGQLTIDVYQTPDDIVIESAVAGVRPEDLDINVTNDSITIRGKRHRDHKVRDEDYFYQECYWGRFSRSVILPQEVDPDSASVTFKGGILTVRLPKMNRQKTKKLKVKLD